MHILEKVAKALSRNYGIEVEFKGKHAATNGTKIVLPTLPEDITETDEMKIRGLCDHEIGHLKYTDFSQFKSCTGKVRKLTNLLEDFRIEKCLGDDYPGAKVNIEKVARHLSQQEDINPDNIINKLWVEGRRHLSGYTFDEPDYTAAIKEAFGNDIFNRISAMASTQDAKALAEHMLKEKDEIKPESQDEARDNYEASESSKIKDAKNNEQEGAESSDPCDDDKNSDEDNEGNEDNKGNPGDNPETNKDQNKTESDNKPTDPNNEESTATIRDLDKAFDDWEDKMDALKKHVESLHTKALWDGKYIPFDTSRDFIKPISPADNIREYNKLKKSLGSLNTVKTKMANLFLTRVASRWTNDRENGKINNRALAKVKTGYKNVFREKLTCQDADTAISFLVDFSGSMNGRKIKDAMRAVVLFLETLQSTKIKSEVLGYTTAGNYSVKTEDRFEYGRVEFLATYIIKEFFEVYGQKVKKRISNWKGVMLANNCDAENVKIAYDRLRRRPEKRKILFVLSDGAVCNRGNCTIGVTYLKELVDKIAKEGVVELIGIGLLTDVSKYYPKHINIRTSDMLVPELFNQLKSVLNL